MKKISILIFTLITIGFAMDFTFTQAFQNFKKGMKTVNTDPQKAQIYFQKAYMFLSEIKKPSSQKYYLLGKMYCNGWGVPRNYQKAEKYFKKALKLGNERVYCCLARLYIRMGRYKEAKKYLNYAISHETLAPYCKDINPKTLKEIK